MKIKNTLLLCLSLSFAFACRADNLLTEDLSQKEVTAKLEDFFDEAQTPLDTSIRNLRDFFAVHDVGSMNGLKGRGVPAANKTARFNDSFLEYVKQVYNHSSYAEYIAQDASHVVEFAQLGRELNLSPDYMYVGMRLFYNKYKATEIVNDSVVRQLLPSIAQHFAQHFSTQAEDTAYTNLDFIKKHTEEVILHKFTEHFTRFQTTPDTFIEELASDLAAFYKQQEQTMTRAIAKRDAKQDSLVRLRQVTLRFFELTLNKTMWNMLEPDSIWASFVQIAEGIQGLAEKQLIDHMDDLDDLFWTLTHRFGYFVELAGAELPLSFYDKVEESLINRDVRFLEMNEQDDGITSKKQLLIEKLLKGKTLSIASQHGIIAAEPFQN